MPDSSTFTFTKDETEVLTDVLYFGRDDLGIDEDIESALNKIYNEELFNEQEVAAIRQCMWYADNHMHRRHNITGSLKLTQHWTGIDIKLDAQPED